MADRRKVEALIAAQTRAGTTLLDRLVQSIRVLLPKPGASDWYRPELYVAKAQRFADLSLAAQRNRAAVSAKFTEAVLRDLGDPVRAPQVDVTDLRGGTDPLEVWQRPFEQYRYQVSAGKSPEDALSAAVARAQALADDNLQMADRLASQETMALSPKTIGYRRVIRPELSAGGSCGLCIAASTRLYKVSVLRAIHENCHCVNVPVTADDDLGDVLNTFDLGRLYSDNGGSTDGRALKYTRYKVNEHGELGPVLRRQGDKFKDDAAPDPSDRLLSPEQAKAARDDAIRDLNRLITDDADDAAVDAAKDRIRRLNRIAAKAA